MNGEQAGDRPVNVAIVNRKTGKRLPCELSYQGVEDGMHVWRIDTMFDPATEKITVGVFPPRTTLSFPADIQQIIQQALREEE